MTPTSTDATVQVLAALLGHFPKWSLSAYDFGVKQREVMWLTSASRNVMPDAPHKTSPTRTSLEAAGDSERR